MHTLGATPLMHTKSHCICFHVCSASAFAIGPSVWSCMHSHTRIIHLLLLEKWLPVFLPFDMDSPGTLSRRCIRQKARHQNRHQPLRRPVYRADLLRRTFKKHYNLNHVPEDKIAPARLALAYHFMYCLCGQIFDYSALPMARVNVVHIHYRYSNCFLALQGPVQDESLVCCQSPSLGQSENASEQSERISYSKERSKMPQDLRKTTNTTTIFPHQHDQ